jgi:serine protease Do
LGISFAIPSNVARRGLESLIKTGRVSRGYLGVMMMNVTPELAREFGAPDTNGALITDVIAGSPADRAGLRSGDIIKEVNGRETKDSLAVRSRIADVDLGGKLDVAVLREGQRVTVSAEIAEVPDALASSTAPPQPPSAAPLRSRPRQNARANVLSGVQVIEIPAAMRQSALEKSLGVMVEQIAPGTPAAATLRPGDIIEEINQQKIASLSDYEKIADSLSAGEKALLYVLRGANRSFVVLTP